ncbi:Similar to Inversin; acc. no. O89019 [Pyronema omphalodes CBS 100304]|uniref:Similar to Inversin acc. no. O89019 n=1 Tax=Pyronema omphalodes (strain CBS 100304) TaxID=1076935 RepID=U4LD82_PYROM|nr:Similar to Inversin; acc. no. O89019 [Pyronema omphalodes CBS 100304]
MNCERSVPRLAEYFSKYFEGKKRGLGFDYSHIHLSTSFGLDNVLRRVIEYYESHINTRDVNGRTPLLIATGRNCTTRTPLSYSTIEDKMEALRLLLAQSHVDLNSKNSEGMTALAYVIKRKRGNYKALKLLLKYDDVVVNSQDNSGETPRLWTVKYGDIEAVELLLAREDISASMGDTPRYHAPLYDASEASNLDIIKLLLEHSGVNVLNSTGRSSLSYFAEHGNPEAIKFILGQRSIVTDSKDSSGEIPLSWAAQGGHTTAVKFLLDECGADVQSKHIFGRTPLSAATERGHTAVIEFLFERGAEAYTPDNEGSTPLSWGAGRGQTEAIKLLMKHDIQLDSKDIYGGTPLLKGAT